MATETSPIYTVPAAHVKMYTANVRHALEKQGGLLSPYFSDGSYSGEKAQVVNYIGIIEFEDVNSVHQDVNTTEVEHTQRWITGKQRVAAVLVDRQDQLRMIYDPNSPYVEAMRAGAARKMDEVCMNAFFASARTGEDGLTLTPFPSTDTVAEADSGLTIAKLRALRKLMKQHHVDLRSVNPYVAITSAQADDLLGEAEVQSIETNNLKPLVEGEVRGFMGFTFVPYEDRGDGLEGRGIPTSLDGSSNTIRECPVWVPNGMHHGYWHDLDIVIQRPSSKVNSTQIKSTFMNGATRLEEGRVFKLECQE